MNQTLASLLPSLNGVSITIAIDDLREVIREIVNEERERTLAEAAAKKRLTTSADVMRANEVMELLGVTRSSLYNLRRRGELMPCRIGRNLRYLRSEVEAFLRGRNNNIDNL